MANWWNVLSNPSKQKGTAFEAAVKQSLLDAGFDVRRMPPAGNKDVGDLQIMLRTEHTDGYKIVIECKATREIDLAGAVKEANIECDNRCWPSLAAIAGIEASCVYPHAHHANCGLTTMTQATRIALRLSSPSMWPAQSAKAHAQSMLALLVALRCARTVSALALRHSMNDQHCH